MKRIIIPILIGLISFYQPIYAEDTLTAKVTTDLNVREQPDKNAKIVDVLKQGQVIEVSECEKSDWNKVSFDDYEGYVYNKYLVSNKDPEFDQIEEFDESEPAISIADFQYVGIFSWNGWQWTYYLMSQFPGQTSTPVEGRYVNENGFVCDSEGYVILASADLPPYTILQTPLGELGKVYDTGCPHGIIDIYTNW